MNRGLIEATRSESELAGVLAHEIAHVALRHGTHQASKAYAAQAGLGILGGLLGRDEARRGQIIDAIGGIGLNAVFLKFSRNDEYEADLVGARMMKRAGYAPAAMASFFDLLNRQREREPGKLEQFFSSHPAPADRAARFRAEAERLGPVDSPREVGGYASVKDELRGRPSSPRRTARLSPGAEPEERGRNRPALPRIEAPSSRLRTFQQRDGFYEIEYPSNWRAHEAAADMASSSPPKAGSRTTAGAARTSSTASSSITTTRSTAAGAAPSRKRPRTSSARSGAGAHTCGPGADQRGGRPSTARAGSPSCSRAAVRSRGPRSGSPCSPGS